MREMCTIERLGSAAIMHSLKSSPSSGGAASQLRAVTSSEAGFTSFTKGRGWRHDKAQVVAHLAPKSVLPYTKLPRPAFQEGPRWVGSELALEPQAHMTNRSPACTP